MVSTRRRVGGGELVPTWWRGRLVRSILRRNGADPYAGVRCRSGRGLPALWGDSSDSNTGLECRADSGLPVLWRHRCDALRWSCRSGWVDLGRIRRNRHGRKSSGDGWREHIRWRQTRIRLGGLVGNWHGRRPNLVERCARGTGRNGSGQQDRPQRNRRQYKQSDRKGKDC